MAAKANSAPIQPLKGPSGENIAIEYLPIDQLVPYAKNAKAHPPKQISQIAASLQEFGFIVPMLVDKANVLVAGHGRILGAKEAGFTQVPVIRAEHLSEKQIRAFRIADNKLQMNSDFLEDLLGDELKALDDEGFDLSLLGFSGNELDTLLVDDAELARAEETPAVPENPVTVKGDVWIMGKHRLVCGDSTVATDVDKALNGVKPHLCVTDPPYGVNYDPEWRNEAARTSKGMGNRAIGAGAIGKVLNDDRADWTETYALFPGDVIYVWHPPGARQVEFYNSLVAAGFDIRMQIIWAKNQLVIGRGHYHMQHEPCQPAGTLVSKVLKDGRWREHSIIEQVPIETLKAGDKVVSFANAKIYRRGQEITKIGKRSYSGNMHRISVGGLATKATAEHQFTVRFDPDKDKSCILYLMRRGDRWRIGMCKMFNSRGFGLAVRLDQECGEGAWILSAHPTKRSARVAEQVVSCVYGIPTTHWEINRNADSGWEQRNLDEIEQIYRQIGPARLADSARRLLADHGLNPDHPLIQNGEEGRFSRKQSRIVRACNLLPGIMQLPIPTHGEDFIWRSIDEATFDPVVDTDVWSMDVARDQHYVADGIVTHNCWYAVRKKQGATAHWQGDRTQATLWKIDKPRSSETGHSTQKPVECMLRPMQNNSSQGQAVYDPFLGSGTSVIAAEMSGRSCHGLELNPAYCDVICQRWQTFANGIATLEGDGRTFDEIKQERHGKEQDAA